MRTDELIRAAELAHKKEVYCKCEVLEPKFIAITLHHHTKHPQTSSNEVKLDFIIFPHDPEFEAVAAVCAARAAGTKQLVTDRLLELGVEHEVDQEAIATAASESKRVKERMDAHIAKLQAKKQAQ